MVYEYSKAAFFVEWGLPEGKKPPKAWVCRGPSLTTPRAFDAQASQHIPKIKLNSLVFEGFAVKKYRH